MDIGSVNVVDNRVVVSKDLFVKCRMCVAAKAYLLYINFSRGGEVVVRRYMCDGEASGDIYMSRRVIEC